MTDHLGAELRRVVLIDLPLALWSKSEEHFADLLREFALISVVPSQTSPIPKRLLEIVDQLIGEYSQFTESQNEDLAAAAGAGKEALTLEFFVPAGATGAARDLRAILDETDEYCAAGAHLLTLETPPALRRYREWYLAQFIDQLSGQPPVSWNDWPA